MGNSLFALCEGDQGGGDNGILSTPEKKSLRSGNATEVTPQTETDKKASYKREKYLGKMGIYTEPVLLKAQSTGNTNVLLKAEPNYRGNL